MRNWFDYVFKLQIILYLTKNLIYRINYFYYNPKNNVCQVFLIIFFEI